MATLNENTTELENILALVNALPATGPGVGDFETWTITLTDGTVIEKEVSVL